MIGLATAWMHEPRNRHGEWTTGGPHDTSTSHGHEEDRNRAGDFVGQMDATDFHDQRVDMEDQAEPTPDEARALRSYMGSSTEVNNALRGRAPRTPATDKVQAGLDSLIAKHATTKELRAVRGIFGDATKVLGPTNLTGATIKDKSYTSVSLDADVAGEFMDTGARSDNAVVFLTIPKGYHATPGVEDEFELILARGGHYKVTADYTDPVDGVRKLFAEAL